MSERPVPPDFELPATGNQRFQLSAPKGHPFLFYFTPGCTTGGSHFRDLQVRCVERSTF